MEDLFSNPYSEIPDQLWKSPSPAERQLAAVEYWAHLTHKTAASPVDSVRKFHKVKDFIRNPKTVTGTAALVGAGVAAGSSLKNSKTDESGMSLAQKKNLLTRQAYERSSELGMPPSKFKKKTLEIKERLAEIEKEHPVEFAAAVGSMGAAVAAGMAQLRLKKVGV